MNKVVELLNDPAFWVGGVLMAIVVNIISSYAKQRLDRYLARYSKARTHMLAEKAEKRKARIAEMTADLEVMAYYRHQELVFRIYLIGAAALSFVVMQNDHSDTLSAKIFKWGFVLVMFATSLALQRSANSLSRDIEEAAMDRRMIRDVERKFENL